MYNYTTERLADARLQQVMLPKCPPTRRRDARRDTRQKPGGVRPPAARRGRRPAATPAHPPVLLPLKGPVFD